MDLKTLMRLYAIVGSGGGSGLIERTATGNPAVFTTDVEENLVSLVIPFTPTQAGSGDPSPSNYRAISGESGVTITHDGTDYEITFPALGKNLCKVTANSKETAGVKWVVKGDGTIDVDGTASGYSSIVIGVIDVPANSVITISGMEDVTNIVWDTFQLQDASGTAVGTYSGGSKANKTIDMSEIPGAVKVRLAAKRVYNSLTQGTIRPMVTLGSGSPGEFEPYTNYCFNGSLDAVTGALTIESAGVVYNGGFDETWYLENSDVFYIMTPSTFKRGTNADDLICSLAKSVDSSSTLASGECCISSEGYLKLKIGSLINKTTVEDFMEWLESYSFQIVCKLTTPITVQLDPVTIATIIGENSISTSTSGSNTITYWKKK